MQKDPQSIALMFNECITNADLEGLVALMTHDHTFIDMADNICTGRDFCRDSVWQPFFEQFRGYRNIFGDIRTEGSVVTMRGYLVCDDSRLDNVMAIWVGTMEGEKVKQWRIYPDNLENCVILGMSE